MNHASRLVLVGSFVRSAAERSGTGSTVRQWRRRPAPGRDRHRRRDRDGGSRRRDTATGGATGACVPTVPTIAWTNPYAGWSRGIPTATDPTFFPIAVWLQGSWHATEMAAARDQHLRRQQRRHRFAGRRRSGHAEGAGDLRHRRAGLGRPGQHRRPDHRRLVDDARRAGQRAGQVGRHLLRSAGRARDAGHAVQRLQGRRSDAADLPRARAGRRLRRLGGARQQRAGRVRLHAGGRHRRLRHLPVQQLRRRRERAGDLRPVLAERVRRSIASTSGRRAGRRPGPTSRRTTIAAGGTHPPTPQQTKSEVWLSLIHGANGDRLLRRHLEPELPRGRHLRRLDDGRRGDRAERSRSRRWRPSSTARTSRTWSASAARTPRRRST